MAPEPPRPQSGGFEPSSGTYNILCINISSSSQISSCVQRSIKHLRPSEPDQTALPSMVILKAHAKVATKLITITEIANRELKKASTKVFQYNALSAELMEVKQKQKPKEIEDGEAEQSDDDAFQDPEEKSKVRNTPVLTVYLCRNAIAELRRDYGEQINLAEP